MPTPPAPCGNAFEEARKYFIDGLACIEGGRFEVAEQCFLSSLSLQPGRVSTLVNLAATQLELSRPQDSLVSADQVLAQRLPDDPAPAARQSAITDKLRSRPKLS